MLSVRIQGFAVALAVVCFATAAASAESAPAASESGFAYDLAGELMSPFCPGRTLAACPSPQAGELIQWIALQEAAGATRDEVVAQLIERHGEEILGAPPARGITLWAYVFPILGFIGFGGVALVVLRRLVGRPARVPAVAVGTNAAASRESGTSDAATASREELARIVDAELAERA